MNEAERTYACKLFEMINSLDAEGVKAMNELRNDALKEILTINIYSFRLYGLPHDAF